jgi:hypothetical protein
MEIKFFDANDHVNEIDISNVMLIHEIIELPTDRNYYIEFYTADEQTSLQYLLFKNGFINSGTGWALKQHLDCRVWIQKKDPGFSLAIINSHTKKFSFSLGLANEQWGYYMFNDVFELKPEYKGYLAGKSYGI